MVGLAACGGGGSGGASSGATAALNVAVVGNGAVSSQPAGIDCGVHCSAAVTLGTTVQLTATPATGHVFSSWSGACSGSTATCSLTVNSTRNVTATFVAAATASGWSSELALSAAGAGDPRVAIDGAGRAIAIWSQLDSASSSTTSLWGSRYLPASGWSVPQLLESNAGTVDGSRISLAMDRTSGRAVVAWRQLTTTTYDLWAKSFDPAVGWGATTLLEAGSGMVGAGSVGIDSSGNALAVWSQIGPSVRYSIYASRHSAGTWSAPVLLETNEVVGVQDTDPKLALLPSGAAVAVWMRSTGSSASLWTNAMSSAGSWGTAAEVVADAGATQWIGLYDLRVDAIGNGMLAWGQLDTNSNAIWYKRYASGAWQGMSVQVASPTVSTGLVSTPVLAMNSAGAALVSWGIQDGTLFAGVASAGGGFGSRATIRATSSSTPSSLPAIGIDDQSSGMAAWTETNGNLYLASRSGGTWGSPTLHENQVDSADQPALAMNDLGYAVLAWRQYVAGTGTRIFVRQYDSGR
jgi:hypothetical protein